MSFIDRLSRAERESLVGPFSGTVIVVSFAFLCFLIASAPLATGSETEISDNHWRNCDKLTPCMHSPGWWLGDPGRSPARWCAHGKELADLNSKVSMLERELAALTAERNAYKHALTLKLDEAGQAALYQENESLKRDLAVSCTSVAMLSVQTGALSAQDGLLRKREVALTRELGIMRERADAQQALLDHRASMIEMLKRELADLPNVQSRRAAALEELSSIQERQRRWEEHRRNCTPGAPCAHF